jgi:hypothetical protein
MHIGGEIMMTRLELPWKSMHWQFWIFWIHVCHWKVLKQFIRVSLDDSYAISSSSPKLSAARFWKSFGSD